jgi:hypothetical protein
MPARLQRLWWRELRYPVPPGCPPEEARDALERAIVYEFGKRDYQAEPAGAHRFTFMLGFVWPPWKNNSGPNYLPVQDFQVELEQEATAVRLRYRIVDRFNLVRACLFSIVLAVWSGPIPGALVGIAMGSVNYFGGRVIQQRYLAPVLAAAARRVFPQAPPI